MLKYPYGKFQIQTGYKKEEYEWSESCLKGNAIEREYVCVGVYVYVYVCVYVRLCGCVCPWHANHKYSCLEIAEQLLTPSTHL